MVFLIYFLLCRHIVYGHFHKVNFSLINDDMMIDIKKLMGRMKSIKVCRKI